MTDTDRRQVYAGFEGGPNPSERDRIVHFIDIYSLTEGLTSQYLEKWAEVSPDPALRGGLRIVRDREASHSHRLKERLGELGKTNQASIAPERREQSFALYASAERSDLEKLESLADLFSDPKDFMQPLVDLIVDIKDDLQSKELLTTIMADEYASIDWLVEMYRQRESYRNINIET